MLPWPASTGPPRAAALGLTYHLILVALSDVDDVSEGRNDVDVDASEVESQVPVL